MAAGSDPATAFAAVAKSDTVPIGGGASRGLYIGGGGDVVVKSVSDGSAVTFKAVPAGTILPIRVNFVMAATTATDIIALG